MAPKSMTGFSRADGGTEAFTWHWELRSVNGRGLDLRFRFPAGYEALEAPARELCKARLARGSCTLALSVRQQAGATRMRLNEELFRQASAAAESARALAGSGGVSLDTLLSIRGVIEMCDEEPDEAAVQARMAAILDDLTAAVDALVASRGDEGARLTAVVSAQMDEIERLVAGIEAAPARTPEAIQARLKEQVERLLGEARDLEPQRLYQEAALLATKADIEEEIARLKAHLAAGRELLATPEPVGRRLEFLTQEFNREANTICSKSNDTEVSQAGLALKAVIDRMREQVQNIE